MAGQRLEGLRADEALRVLGHRHLHLAPASRRRRTSSAALYAAMPPQTHSRTRLSVQRAVRASAIVVGKFLRRNRRASLPDAPRARPMPAAAARARASLQAMHIRDWPAAERPREKLLARGAGALSDAELLAIFLGSGLRGRDAVATARELLAAHGPLRALLERTPGRSWRSCPASARPAPARCRRRWNWATATSPPTWNAARR